VARESAGRRRHARGIHLSDFIGIGEDIAELSRKELDLGRIELEIRESRNGNDLLGRESAGHAKC
jgi:hypothetical protein